MRLHSISVVHWRGLENVSIGPLSPHLNLICGPNRSGKSRLQAAIRFALLESSKGAAAHKAQLQSKHSNESPRVTLVFEMGGVEYEIQKQFLKGAFTKLSGGGKTLEGEEAEVRLRALLGTRTAKREVDIPESGIWPLLMVEQGRSGEVPHAFLNEDSRHQLQGRLAGEVGVATIGKIGKAVMAKAEAEYQRHFTAVGSERQDLKQARIEADNAQRDLQAATAKLDAVHDLASEVERLRKDVETYEPRIAHQQVRLKDVEGKAVAAAEARATLTLAREKASRGESDVQAADGEVKKRNKAESALQELHAEHAKAAKGHESLTAKVGRLATDLAAVDAKVTDAENRRTKARATAIHVHAASRKKELKKRIDDRTRMLATITTISTDAAKLTKERAALAPFTEKVVGQLRTLEKKSLEAQAELKGAAVSVQITALKDTTVDGKPWAKGKHDERSLAGSTTLKIADLVELKIQPGGSELGTLRDHAKDAAQTLRDKLAELGVETVAEAETKAGKLRSAAEKLEGVHSRLEEMAPSGVEVLTIELNEMQGEHNALEVPIDLPTEVAADKADREADDLCAELRAQRESINGQLAEARTEMAKAELTTKSLAGRIKDQEVALGAMGTAEALEAKRNKAQSQLVQAAATRDEAERTYAEAGGDDAALAAEQAKKALDTLLNNRRTSESELIRQRGKLEGAEAEGLYDAQQKAEGEVAHTQAVLDRRLREAAAAKALWDALSVRRRSIQEQLTRPVIKRVAAYLEPLFPGCTLSLSDNMEISGVLAGNVTDEFSDLSGGEKEQLSLAVRLALADVLRGDGTLPLMLDDSLVNTDAERIQVVQQLLYRAARNLQIIVFTCQGPLFDRLGADYTYNLPPRLRAVKSKAA